MTPLQVKFYKEVMKLNEQMDNVIETLVIAEEAFPDDQVENITDATVAVLRAIETLRRELGRVR